MVLGDVTRVVPYGCVLLLFLRGCRRRGFGASGATPPTVLWREGFGGRVFGTLDTRITASSSTDRLCASLWDCHGRCGRPRNDCGWKGFVEGGIWRKGFWGVGYAYHSVVPYGGSSALFRWFDAQIYGHACPKKNALFRVRFDECAMERGISRSLP